MAYNSKSLKTDANGNPVSQYWNPTADDYGLLEGKNGATRSDPGVYITASIAAGSVTVGTTEVELCAGASALANRRGMKIRCEGNDAIYIGPTGVTTSSGYTVVPGEEIILRFDPEVATAVYAIAASNQTVRVLEWS